MINVKSQVLAFIKSRYPDFVHSGEIERYAMTLESKAQTADRKCRELENEGKIERAYQSTKTGRKCVIYRAIIEQKQEVKLSSQINSQPQLI
jgi:predicted transcriptional regulator